MADENAASVSDEDAEPGARDGNSSDTSATGSTGVATADGRPALIDATQYDFDRLERAIGGLVAQQQALALENEALRARVVDRDAEVERLASELRQAVERRTHALDRVDALIDELDRLDASLDDAMVDWVEGAETDPADRESPSSPPG